MGAGIIAVDFEQVDLVGRRVVADITRGHPFDADRERQRHQGTTTQVHSRRLSTNRQISQLSGMTAIK